MAETRSKYRPLQWILLATVLIHNGEEYLTMPHFLAESASFLTRFPLLALSPPTIEEWNIALVIATLLPAGLLLFGATGRLTRLKVQATALVAAIFFLNVFLPHLFAVVALRGYAPGVFSAVGLNLPITVWTLRRSVQSGWLTGVDIIRLSGAALLFLVATLMSVFLLM